MNERLGRGLSALIPDNKEESNRQMGLSTLPIDKIRLNRLQPRMNFDQEKLNELAESIKENGIIQPLIVTKTQGSEYELIAGERRLQAAKIAGLDIVPVVIRSVSQKEQLQLAIVENIQREDLNPIEEALAYHTLAEDFGLSHAQIAQTMSKSRSTITNSIRLLKLSPQIQEMINSGELSAGHARAILSLEEHLQLPFAQHIVKYKLSVRQAEEKAGSFRLETPKTKASVSPVISGIQSDLQRTLGMKVKIKGHINKGQIAIEYRSQEELAAFKSLINKLREQDQ
ncbi:MAG: ParB/RepB/Spo0J family partition protein [Candidatus Cloacimonetes bacterium]|nr:ParB/RepB/Spo0J family partition protein [Candidatus Cloacimonadota bacterium]